MRIGITYNIKTSGYADLSSLAAEDAFEEFDSPETIKAISAVFEAMGHEVVLLGWGRQAVEGLINSPIDFVFNIAEGYSGRSREAQIPALLEMLDIPYSGPDPLSAALTLDKVLAKKIALNSGVPTPDHGIIWPRKEFNLEKIEFPAILKLAWEGSSKGIRNTSRVNDPAELTGQIEWLSANYPDQPILAEAFVPGREFTVAVAGNFKPEILGIMEIRPKDRDVENFIYSLEVKRDYLSKVEYKCPPDIDPSLKDKLARSALKLYAAFGLRDISRFDFRVDQNHLPQFLEVNPLPGLNPITSDLVIMAKLMGMSYDELIRIIFNHALERTNVNVNL